ncbi:hypothetical protein [Terriglobus tenax]|uniref:hypothetical protein n=1 Tax=Terriglobus tenax TaxID=1111115 RepID=UPI0021DFC429|nr:hypothetical protein [Terriglobus tenax]
MLVVVGGHTRNIGKTSAVCELIRSFPAQDWTAVKITQYGHSVCSANGEPCDCQTADHTLALSEERNAETGTDTSRYLAAGAARSLWLRTRQGQLAEAMPRLRMELAKAANNVLESNSVIRLLRPDLYLAVLSPGVVDFKPSAQYVLDRADAFLLTEPLQEPAWQGISQRLVLSKPHFAYTAGEPYSAELLAWLASRLNTEAPPEGSASGQRLSLL